jgi:hypothetical protein
MPTTYQRAQREVANQIANVNRRIANLRKLNAIGNNQNKWRELTHANRHRLHQLKKNRNAKPNDNAYNYAKLQETLRALRQDVFRLKFFYGYKWRYNPRNIKNVTINGRLYSVPLRIPNWEAVNFHRAGGNRRIIAPGPYMNKRHNVYSAKGWLKPLKYGPWPRPVPARAPKRGYLPTLKELAWAATPMPGMTNEQLRFVSQMTPMNLMMLKPKRRAAPLSPTTLTKLRRNLAARTIQRAVKKRR